MTRSYSVQEVIAIIERALRVDSYFPFGPYPQCFRVGGKIFAEVSSQRV